MTSELASPHVRMKCQSLPLQMFGGIKVEYGGLYSVRSDRNNRRPTPAITLQLLRTP